MLTQAEKVTQNIQQQQIFHVGASPLLWAIMKQLGIESEIDKNCPCRQQGISHGKAALAIILSRILQSRPMYKMETWLEDSGLDQALGEESETFNDDRLGRMLDAI